MAHSIGAQTGQPIDHLTQSHGDCVFALSLDRHITAVNQTTLDLLGHTKSTLLGKPIAAILGGPSTRRNTMTLLPEIMGAPGPLELTLYAQDERPVPVLFRSTLLTMESGEEVILCHAQPKISESLKEWGAIQADMLRQSQDEFLSNMSHELRTPLTGIIGMAQILEESSLASEQREQLKIILNCGSNLLGFVNRVLDFKEVRDPQAELNHEEFSLADMVHSILDRFEPTLSSKNLHCSVHFDANVPDPLLGDSEKLRRTLDCLLDNAVKFTEPGGDVGIRVVRESTEGNMLRLRLSIRDTGVGIPASKQDLVFEPFQQADGSRTRRFSGGGLGLSLAREWVRTMKGELWVDSDPGWGSEFHVSIPMEIPPRGLKDQSLIEKM